MYEQMTFKVRGVAPLLMHNGRLSNPLNEYAKEMKRLSGKRNKTDDDYAEMARVEFLGGLYTDDSGHPVVPGELIEATLIAGAKKKRSGPAAKAGVIVDGNFPLQYKGPKTAEKLVENVNFHNCSPVKVQQNRVMRTRPQFDEWAVEFTVHYLPEQANKEDVKEWVEVAGRMCGFGDWRPRFGRFEIEEVS